MRTSALPTPAPTSATTSAPDNHCAERLPHKDEPINRRSEGKQQFLNAGCFCPGISSQQALRAGFRREQHQQGLAQFNVTAAATPGK